MIPPGMLAGCPSAARSPDKPATNVLRWIPLPGGVIDFHRLPQRTDWFSVPTIPASYQITAALGDHHLARKLRIVFEHGLLPLIQDRGFRLHYAIGVRGARNQRVLARRRAFPLQREELPSVLATRRVD